MITTEGPENKPAGEQAPPDGPAAGRGSVSRAIPVAVLVLGLVAYFVFDLDRFLSLEVLKENREFLVGWVESHGAWSGIVFAAIYAVAVAFSVPGAVILTIIGGFMFGPYHATLYVVIGATVGATVLFLAARHAFSDLLVGRVGPWLRKMEVGFNKHPVSYMLILRLVPLFPFWLVNLVPAFLGVSTMTYFFCTLFGIIPGTFVYALLGDGAGAVLDAGKDLNLHIIFEFRFIAPIIGLILLACIPVICKELIRRGNGEA